MSRRPGGGIRKRAEEAALVSRVRKTEERRPDGRFIGGRQFARTIAEQELELARGRFLL